MVKLSSKVFYTSVITLLVIFLSGCGGLKSPKVIPVQTADPSLSCKELMSEIREAEEYKAMAQRNRTPGISTFIAPLGYAYTLTSAGEAIEASEQRIEYLGDMLMLAGCVPNSEPVLNKRQLRGHTFSGGYPTPPAMYNPNYNQQLHYPPNYNINNGGQYIPPTQKRRFY